MDKISADFTKQLIALLVAIHVLCHFSPSIEGKLKGGYADQEGNFYKFDSYFPTVPGKHDDEYNLKKGIRLERDGPILFLKHVKSRYTFLGEAVQKGEIWRLVSGAFLHGSWLHILCNCYCLWQILPWCIQTFGMKRAQTILWASVLGGAVLSGVWEPAQHSLGISGGVFGLFAVYTLSLWKIKQSNDSPQIQSALRSALFMIGANLLLGFQIEQISNTGHIGGLLVGLGLGIYYLKIQLKRQPDFE